MKELEPSVDSVAGQQRAELRWGESKGTHEGKVAAPITSQMLVCRDPATLLAGTRAPVSDGVHTGPFKAALLSEHRLRSNANIYPWETWYIRYGHPYQGISRS